MSRGGRRSRHHTPARHAAHHHVVSASFLAAGKRNFATGKALAAARRPHAARHGPHRAVTRRVKTPKAPPRKPTPARKAAAAHKAPIRRVMIGPPKTRALGPRPKRGTAMKRGYGGGFYAAP